MGMTAFFLFMTLIVSALCRGSFADALLLTLNLLVFAGYLDSFLSVVKQHSISSPKQFTLNLYS